MQAAGGGNRIPVIAANWKMNNTITDTRTYFEEFFRGAPPMEERQVVFCPPFTSLQSARMLISGKKGIFLGAQNLFWKESGAFTGECSGPMLKDLGVEYVIVGHSERRTHFGETNSIVAKKLHAALACNLKPILCIGEQEKTRKSGKTLSVVKKQFREAVSGTSAKEMQRVVIAYEPVWAIGTGLNATPSQAQEVHAMIRGMVAELYSAELARAMRVIYGGSVTPENVGSLMEMEDIDGALVGGASLKPQSFLRIVFYDRKAILE
jgi:triosephosphate isomerase